MPPDPPRTMSTTFFAVSPPSPPPPSSPFSLLPPELVRTIIESAVPHHFDFRHYRARQSTLRSFCLVSKLFRQIANPFLFSVVQFSSAKVWGTWRKFSPKTRARARDIAIGDDSGTYIVQAEVVNVLAESCSHLNTLSLYACFSDCLDINHLSCANRLTTLRLSHVVLESFALCPLLSVQEVSLYQVASNTPFSSIFNPATFPSLKYLSWQMVLADPVDFATTLYSLLDQVETLALDLRDFRHLSKPLLDILSEKTLFDTARTHLDGPLPKYIRFFAVNYNNFVLPSEFFDEVAESLAVSTSPTLPSILYLPLERESDYLNLATGYRTYWYDFRRICVDKGIEVVFEEQSKFRALGNEASEDFRKKMKESKIRKAAA